MRFFVFCLLTLIVSNIGLCQPDITQKELKEHIVFLTSKENAGRYPGGAINRKITRYIKRNFKKAGIKHFKNGYLQAFKAALRTYEEVTDKPIVKTWNVIGFLEGNDPNFKNEFIVLGAHYDHLGLGGPSSKSPKRNTIHYGADDNASGTAALLEIAEKLASVKKTLKRSIVFIAFGAEEQGLLGSQYFVDNPPMALSEIKLMINMDMVGRLNEQQQVYMGGAGTFPEGMSLMKSLGDSLGLNPIVHAGSVGGSDHVSFYRKDVSVLGIHTGGHPQYHTPEDTIDLINYPGEKLVCDYIYATIFTIAATSYALEFIKQD